MTADITAWQSRPLEPKCPVIFFDALRVKVRDECLSLEWFRNRTDARIVTESWRRHFNEVRPHSNLGNLTPAEFKRRCSTTRPAEAICQV